jgi:hypothetical protein
VPGTTCVLQGHADLKELIVSDVKALVDVLELLVAL